MLKKKMQITNYTIRLQNIHLYAHHGVMEQERAIGAWFTIDAALQMNDSSAITGDDISGTVSYADVYEIIKEEMQTPSNLLEHVSSRIINKIFDRFATVEKIEITLAKDTPPMGGDRLNAAVTIEAKR